MRKLIAILILPLLAASPAKAAEPEAVTGPDSLSIVTSLNSPGSTVTVRQPRAMDSRTSYGSKISVEADRGASSGRAVRQGGFRIQVFSDNNVRTAKSNAEYRKRTIEQRMPGTRAYLKYESPYWRVQVGDYRSRSEAEAALREIRSAFPSYSSELKIVSERVNIQQ